MAKQKALEEEKQEYFVLDIVSCIKKKATQQQQQQQQQASSSYAANSEHTPLLFPLDPEVRRILREEEEEEGTRTADGGGGDEDELVNPAEVEADCLLEIESCPRLKRILAEWERRFKVASLRIEKKSTRSINAKNELYQLIGFYSVFQGVVLTAAAQTNLIECPESWGPAALSFLASVATIASVYNKLLNYSDHRQALQEEIADSKDLEKRIWSLKASGTRFEFPKTKTIRKTSQGLESFYFWAVLLSLVLFSVVTLASCFHILCHPRSKA